MSHVEYNSPTYPLSREMKNLPIQEFIIPDTLPFMYQFHATGNCPQIFQSLFIITHQYIPIVQDINR